MDRGDVAAMVVLPAGLDRAALRHAPAPVQRLRVEYGGNIFYKFKMPASEALGVLAVVAAIAALSASACVG